MKEKECSKCHEIKPLNEFYKFCSKKRKRYFAYCKECSLKKSKDWYCKNKKEHINRSSLKYKFLRNKVILLLGGKCSNCPTIDERVLCIDHKNGKGAEERNELCGNGMLYKILREIEKGKNHNYQLLCLNCNWIKAIENGELKRRVFK